METILTVTDAALNLAEIVDRVASHQETTTLLKDGKPVACIVPVLGLAETGVEIAAAMRGRRPILTPEEAEAFERDLQAARAELSPPISPWD